MHHEMVEGHRALVASRCSVKVSASANGCDLPHLAECLSRSRVRGSLESAVERGSMKGAGRIEWAWGSQIGTVEEQ